MPNFPKSKSRPWIPKRERDNKGNRLTSRSVKEFISFYNSKQWRSLRRYYIQMNPLCELCEKQGFTISGQCVDHINPISNGGSKTSLNNLQTLCNSCHAYKTGKEAYERKKKNYKADGR